MKTMAAVALVLLAATSTASAQSTNVFKWTDSAGVVHYTDQPSPNENATQMRLHAKAGVATVPGASSTAPVDKGAPVVNGKLAAAETAARTRNCENARANASTLSGSAMLVNSNDPTSARRMDQDEVDAARKNAQRDIAEYCGGGGK